MHALHLVLVTALKLLSTPVDSVSKKLCRYRSLKTNVFMSDVKWSFLTPQCSWLGVTSLWIMLCSEIVHSSCIFLQGSSVTTAIEWGSPLCVRGGYDFDWLAQSVFFWRRETSASDVCGNEMDQKGQSATKNSITRFFYKSTVLQWQKHHINYGFISHRSQTCSP